MPKLIGGIMAIWGKIKVLILLDSSIECDQKK